MKSGKKGQGLSVNVIIVAAIALIVLVILVAVFTGRFSVFTGGLKGMGDASQPCNENAQGMEGAVLYEADVGSCLDGDRVISAQTSPGKVCCVDDN